MLAFGNYMNSSKRGPVYGFKLQSLESLLETKTHDKKQTLLHFIVQTVTDKFKDITNFDSELTFIDKAAMGTIYLINSSSIWLLTNQDLFWLNSFTRECSIWHERAQQRHGQHKKGVRAAASNSGICFYIITTLLAIKLNKIVNFKSVDSPILKEFLSKAEQQFGDLSNKFKTSQEQFNQCVEYFGETPRSQSPNTFFTTFVKFLKAFNVSKLFHISQSVISKAN